LAWGDALYLYHPEHWPGADGQKRPLVPRSCYSHGASSQQQCRHSPSQPRLLRVRTFLPSAGLKAAVAGSVGAPAPAPLLQRRDARAMPPSPGLRGYPETSLGKTIYVLDS
jgi:hypothetical protein